MVFFNVMIEIKSVRADCREMGGSLFFWPNAGRAEAAPTRMGEPRALMRGLWTDTAGMDRKPWGVIDWVFV